MKYGSITTGIIADGLVFNMDAANRASYPKKGTTLTDTIGSQTGTLSTDEMFDPTQGEGTLAFDQVDDNVNFGNPSVLQITGALSTNIWFKTSSTSNQGLFTKGSGYFQNPTGKVYELGILSQILYFQICDGTTAKNVNYNVSSFLNGSWNNVAGQWDGTTNTNGIKLYFNGELVNQTTSTITSIQNPGLDFVFSDTTGTRKFGGSLGSFQIYNRALSANEILHNYNALKGRFGL